MPSLACRSSFDVQLVMTWRALVALERPVRAVDRMLGHPFGNADLALDHAALKGDVALAAVADDFFDTISGASRQSMTENGHKCYEHQAFLSTAVAACKTDACRGDGRACGRGVIRDCAPEVSAPHLSREVSRMTRGAIEPRFRLARCWFTLSDRARAASEGGTCPPGHPARRRIALLAR